MEQEKIADFKQKLETEFALVDSELRTVGRENPDAPGQWEPVVKDVDQTATEQDELADKFEELEENTDILNALQMRWRNIKRALQKIEDGSYGICEISGKDIELERLEANPAARTCEEHMAEEKNLPL